MKNPANLCQSCGADDADECHCNAKSLNQKFTGTDNPRELRGIAGLMRRAMPREHVDREAGCSNGPEMIANLRRKGLEIPCDRVPVIDRDGFEVRRGVYHLTPKDRRKIHHWFSTRRGQA